MPVLLRWYLVVQILALLAFLVGRPALRRLPDGGWGVAKTLGVLLVGMGCWLGTALGLLRNDLGGAALVVLLLASSAVARTRRRELRALVRSWERWLPAAIAVEVCFLLAFVGWAAFRSRLPSIHHTEQPMDLLFLSAVSSHPSYPTPDPWLSGHPIAYYYLGYWLVGTLAHLTGTPPEIAYNVGLATWGGMLVAACFGLGFSLAASARPGQRRVALAAGGMSALAVAGVGNLHHAWEWLQSLARGAAPARQDWWWWRASRTLQDVDLRGRPIEVITEFPFFSYLLGDLHPHLLSMPVLAAAATLSFATLRDGRWLRTAPATAALRRHGPLAAIVCAALLAINTWDLPAAWLLFTVAAWLALPGEGWGRVRQSALFGGAVLVSALALSTPHLLTASSQVRGLLPNLFHPTPLPAMARAAGVFVVPIALLLGLAWRRCPAPAPRLVRLALAFGAVSLGLLALGALWASLAPAGRSWAGELPLSGGLIATALARWAGGLLSASLLIGALAACVVWLASARRSAAAGLVQAVLVAAVGLLLLLGPELLFVHDVFSTRMNTVFKLHYQAWLLLGVAGGAAVAMAWAERGRWRLAAVGATVVLSLGLMYAPEALRSRGARDLRTLDGLVELRHRAPGELSGIQWLRRHSRPSDVVVHAVGDSYRADQALPSAATGRPTLLGWRGHEAQWRGKRFGELAAGREEAVKALLRPSTPTQLRAMLDRWGVTWVWVGPRERELYGIGGDDERLLAGEMDLAWSEGEVRLYRRRG